VGILYLLRPFCCTARLNQWHCERRIWRVYTDISVLVNSTCVYSFSHGRPHTGPNEVSWPPLENGWKIKKRKHSNKSSFLCLCSILRVIRAGRCRERRYADNIFIQIYFRMHHFVVKFSKFSSPPAARGHWPPNQNSADVPAFSHESAKNLFLVACRWEYWRQVGLCVCT